MDRFSAQQRVQMINLFYQNGSSVRATFRALRPFYGRNNRPTERTIRNVVGKFESTGSVNDKPTLVRRRNARSAENIAAVRESVQKNPKQSISCRSKELGLSQATIWRILHCDLNDNQEEHCPTKTKEPSKDKSDKPIINQSKGRTVARLQEKQRKKEELTADGVDKT